VTGVQTCALPISRGTIPLIISHRCATVAVAIRAVDRYRTAFGTRTSRAISLTDCAHLDRSSGSALNITTRGATVVMTVVYNISIVNYRRTVIYIPSAVMGVAVYIV